MSKGDQIKTGSYRVSSEEQKRKGQQVNFYHSVLNREGVEDDHIFSELARSGSMNEDKDVNYELKDGKFIISFDLKKKRPELYKWLMNYVVKKKTYEHVIPKWDRWARNIFVGEGLYEFCKNYGCEVRSGLDGNEDKQRFFALFMAHIESMFTKDRVFSNKKFKFDNGLYVGTVPPVGYDKAYFEFKGKKYFHIVPNDDVCIVKDVFNPNIDYKDVLAKYSIGKGTYYNIKKNRVYCGLQTFDGEEKKGIWESIITEDEWKRVN